MEIDTDVVSNFAFKWIHYDNRIKTFEKWPVTFLSAERMADNGFYYLGRGDEVRCAFCGVEISYWVEEDHPTREHQIWSPNCRFLNRITGLESENNMKSMLRERDVDCEDEHDWMYSSNRVRLHNNLLNTHNWKTKMREKHVERRERDREDAARNEVDSFGLRPLKPASDSAFELFSKRLNTFKGWPVTFFSAEQMAGNGFYYLGFGDTVRCAYCQVELVKWEEGDDPAKDHQRWSPKCSFAQIIIRTHNRLAGSDTVNCIKSISPEVILRSSDNDHDSPVPLDTHLNLTGAAHPCYKYEDSRLRSFQDSPCIRQNPENLAAAGFFYVGPDDETKCYYCDGVLKDWEPDDVPWEQHARWFGTCAYVKLVKGQDYIQKVMTKGYSMIAPTANRKDEQRETFTKSIKNPDFKLCLICNKKVRDVRFVPCRHIIACTKCSLAIDNCLICRRKIDATVSGVASIGGTRGGFYRCHPKTQSKLLK